MRIIKVEDVLKGCTTKEEKTEQLHAFLLKAHEKIAKDGLSYVCIIDLPNDMLRVIHGNDLKEIIQYVRSMVATEGPFKDVNFASINTAH